MPTNRTRRTRPMDPAVSETVRYFFTGEGEPDKVDRVELFMLRGSTEKVKAAWETIRDEVMPKWIREHPGTRPYYWWRFEATEQRRRIGGRGDTFDDDCTMADCSMGIPDNWVTPHDVEVYNGTWRDVRGNLIDIGFKPGDFTRMPPDPANLPTFESQAAYLARHQVLTAPELKWLTAHAEAMQPEVVTFDEDEDEDDAAEPNSPAAVV